MEIQESPNLQEMRKELKQTPRKEIKGKLAEKQEKKPGEWYYQSTQNSEIARSSLCQ